ncbi:MAG: cupin-like domain-containing protein [Cellvibrio sp.]|uniref:cupin-like domain-containing protein n=1 Tax=Cellvibrio sp. TaxID=1965322 RepID=UPI0031A95B7A
MTAYRKIPEFSNISAEQFFQEIVPLQKPIVIRGFADHWPLVSAAKNTPQAFVAYLKKFYTGNKASILLGHPEIKGRFFYNDDMTGVNYIKGDERLDLFLDRLLELATKEIYPAVSIQNILPSHILPGLVNDNTSSFFPDIEPRLWMGNQGTVSAHYDGSDNVACVVAGRRRFVLFAPEQVANLYPGSLNVTPAGAPVSLVNLHDPDFERYPLYKKALENAYSAELFPGDAIFIPMLWWHHVDSLEKVNGLMNYWWNGSAVKDAIKPTVIDSLNMAVLSMRQLNPAQRNAWRAMFDHYVFKQGVDPVSYIPEHCLHVLGEITPEAERQIKNYLIEKLK